MDSQATSNLTIRIDPALKADFREGCKKRGSDMTERITDFISREVARFQREQAQARDRKRRWTIQYAEADVETLRRRKAALEEAIAEGPQEAPMVLFHEADELAVIEAELTARGLAEAPAPVPQAA